VDDVGGDCGREGDKNPGLSARVGVLPLVGESSDSCVNVVTIWSIEATGVLPSVCPTVPLPWLWPLLLIVSEPERGPNPEILLLDSAPGVDVVEVEKSPLGTLRTGKGPRTVSGFLDTLLSGDADLFSKTAVACFALL
jgi:hypothetical protein